MDTVIITGGTGLIGTALIKIPGIPGISRLLFLPEIRQLTEVASPGISYAAWNIDEQSVNEECNSEKQNISFIWPEQA